MNIKYFLIMASVVLSLPSVAADAAKGADSFAANCAVCHSVANPVKNKIGPGLWGVVGNPAGKVSGYQYSAALQAANIVWTRENLDKYLTNPSSLLPGNKMPFKGIASADERANLIEFLAQQKK